MGCNRSSLWHALGLTTCIIGLMALGAGLTLLSVGKPAWGRGLALGLLAIGALLGVAFVVYSCLVVRHEWRMFGCCKLPLHMKAGPTPWGSWGRQHDLETATPTPEASVGEDDGAWSSRRGSDTDPRSDSGVGDSVHVSDNPAMELYWEPGPWFNVKMSSYQYRKSRCGDKTAVRSSYLHNGISYAGKMASLYGITPRPTLKTEICQDANFVISGGPGGCRHDWQPPVPPVMTRLAWWRLSGFNAT